MKLSRRQTSKLLVAGVALAAVSSPFVAARRQDFALSFQRDLDFHFVGDFNSKLTLRKFDAEERNGKI